MRLLKNNFLGRTIVALFLLISPFTIFAQSNFLKQKVTYSASNEKLAFVLNDIEKMGGFMFSYNAQILDSDSIVSITAKNKSIKYILDYLFENKLQYKAIGTHVILTKPDFDKKTVRQNKDINYSIIGYLIDSKSGEKIVSASIYDLQANQSTITNTEGFFKLEIPTNNEFRTINFSKRGYQDTIIIIRPSNNEINIRLRPSGLTEIKHFEPKKVNLNDTTNNINELRLVNIVVSEGALTNVYNMGHLFQVRPFQISIFPFAGTHLSSSGLYINRLSFNIIAGYSGGVSSFEFGGLLNIDRGRVRWVQFAGLGNIVGGNVQGVQFAGIFNTCRNGVSGLQFAGIANHNKGAVNGAQIAGIFNDSQDSIRGVQFAGVTSYHHGNVSGVQFSGIFSYTHGSVKGAQLSGVVNYCDQNITGAQLSGVANTCLGNIDGAQLSIISSNCKNIKGWQGAGVSSVTKENVDGVQTSVIANIADGNVNGAQAAVITNVAGGDISGVQASVIANVANETNNGTQLSLLINYAKKQNGFQFGLINVCDSIKGVSFGAFTFARYGYIDLALSYNEVFYANMAFKTGAKHFYNIFLLRRGEGETEIWGPGYGFGSSIGLSKKFNLTLELTCTHVNESPEWVSEVNLLNRFSTTLDWKPGKRFKIFAGPALNIHASNLKDDETGEFNSSIAVNPFFEGSNENTQVQMWLGGTVGVAF